MTGFIKVTGIANLPGNPASITYIRVDAIDVVAEAAADYAKIGAASRLDTRFGTVLVTEHLDDVIQMMEQAEP